MDTDMEEIFWSSLEDLEGELAHDSAVTPGHAVQGLLLYYR